MSGSSTGLDDGAMRADARRNRRRLLDAAVALTLELGGEPTMDAVARRAGVGPGTLYRHFPHRQALLRAMVLNVLDKAIEHADAVLAETEDGGEALRRYLHAAVDAGLGVVSIVHPLLEDTDWPAQREAAQHVMARLVEAAVRAGAVPDDFDVRDLGLLAIRFCRPLAIGVDASEERAIAHDQLDTLLDGLVRGDTEDRA